MTRVGQELLARLKRFTARLGVSESDERLAALGEKIKEIETEAPQFTGNPVTPLRQAIDLLEERLGVSLDSYRGTWRWLPIKRYRDGYSDGVCDALIALEYFANDLEKEQERIDISALADVDSPPTDPALLAVAAHHEAIQQVLQGDRRNDRLLLWYEGHQAACRCITRLILRNKILSEQSSRPCPGPACDGDCDDLSCDADK